VKVAVLAAILAFARDFNLGIHHHRYLYSNLPKQFYLNNSV
jgi:hypothetical protein